jgi:O-antigen ligase
VKAKNEFLSSSQDKFFIVRRLTSKLEIFVFSLVLLFLPTQFGKHFWPDFALIQGIRVDYLSPTIYVTDILIGLLFFISIIRKAQSTKRNKLYTKQTFLLPKTSRGFLLFLLFLIINIFLSGTKPGGLYSLGKFLEFSFAAYYISRTIRKKKQFEKMMILLSCGVLLESLLAISQFFNHGSLGGFFYFLGERFYNPQTPGIANASINGALVLRPYGTFSHPNVLAGYLVLLTTLEIFFVPFFTSKKTKTILTVASLVGTAALLLTLSRVAIVVWVIAVFSHFFLQTRRKQGKKKEHRKIFIKASFLCLCLLFLLFSTPLGTRFLHTRLTEESLTQRERLLQGSWHMIQDKPFIGVGIGNFLPTLSSLQKPLSVGLYVQPVHNIFFLIAAETGTIGLLFFIWFLQKTYRRKKLSPIFSLVLTELLILGLFDHYWLTLQQGQLLFAFIFGLCWLKRCEKLSSY